MIGVNTIMVTIEKLCNNKLKDDSFERLTNYFRALEKNKTNEYHKKRGR